MCPPTTSVISARRGIEPPQRITLAAIDLEASPLEKKDKAMLRFVTKMTRGLPAVTSADIERVRGSGWDHEAIYFAITTCALFKFYNCWITATGVAKMSEEAHRQPGLHLARNGYFRDENR